MGRKTKERLAALEARVTALEGRCGRANGSGRPKSVRDKTPTPVVPPDELARITSHPDYRRQVAEERFPTACPVCNRPKCDTPGGKH